MVRKILSLRIMMKILISSHYLLALTEHTSATRVNKDGLIETVGSGEPRIDYKDDSKGALLLEPSRSNLITYSEDFSNASWAKLGSTIITSNYGISPDGNSNSSLVTFGDKTSSNQLYFNLNTSASVYTSSVYLKVSSGTAKFKLGFYDGSIKVTEITLTTQWQRFSVTETTLATTTRGCWIYPDSDNASLNIEIYGAQVEQGIYATSYIPTQGGVVNEKWQESCSGARR